MREELGRAGPIPAILLAGFAPGFEAGITTRERNFRHRERPSDPAVASAYAELDAYAQRFGGWVRVEQVHGARVVESVAGGALPEAGDGVSLGAADGIVLRRGAGEPRARLLTVTVADCVPVFLAWPGGYGVLHAGWRGLAAGILESGLAATGADADAVRVHLGPAIGPCCYEVGPEVPAAVYRSAADRSAAEAAGDLRPGRRDRWRLDLRGALARRARAAGVPETAVTVSGSCTACDLRLHSFRRSGAPVPRELMLAFIGAPAAAEP